jgi:hypothetical protein
MCWAGAGRAGALKAATLRALVVVWAAINDRLCLAARQIFGGGSDDFGLALRVLSGGNVSE